MIEDQPITDKLVLKFPQNFLWGAATSAFQVEGNVRNSDWWRWEQTAQLPSFRSGLAVDHYNRFREDFDLAKLLGHNTHRLGLEWSRIEPAPGEFDPAEITHYKEVLEALKERDMKVMLTLHHFSNPAWFADQGGWENTQAPNHFERFVREVAPQLGEDVNLWVTINEPSSYTKSAYIVGDFPPQKKDFTAFLKVFWNMARAHKKAADTLHEIDPQSKVGITNLVVAYDSYHQHPLLKGPEKVAAKITDFLANRIFYPLSGRDSHDFLGLNYYMGYSFRLKAGLPTMQFMGEEKNDLGWGIYPKGLHDLLVRFSKFDKPIYITENGIPTRDENQRTRFLISHLREVHRAIQKGVDVRGYLHWSLLDNMELNLGFDPRFGLIEVDFETRNRTPKPASYVYKQIIENNGIPQELLKLSDGRGAGN